MSREDVVDLMLMLKEPFSSFSRSIDHTTDIKDWVSKAPNNAIDIVLDVLANPPELDEDDFHEWSWQASKILFYWGKRDPENWLEKLKPFILNKMARTAILGAISMTMRDDKFSCIAPLIERADELDQEEREYFMEILCSCPEPQAQQACSVLKARGKFAC